MSSEHPCGHDRSHIVDSAFYGHRYSTKASRRIFCDRCRYQRWLDVEAALALEQGALGIIPADAAELIAAAARIERIDLSRVREEIRKTSHSLVGLLRVFQDACEGQSGEFVHYGATTQDIQDTAQSVQMRDVLDELDRLLAAIAARLADLADEHAETVALGRTHAQPALPIGFGLKVAGWLDEVVRNGERLRGMRERVCAAQLFGGVGTMAGFGDQALELLEGFSGRLGLSAPRMGWHVARDRVAEFVSGVAITAGTMGRIADEVRILSRPEFGEVETGWRHGQVGSSTMPHKRNPEACEQAVVMARLAAATVNVGLAAMSGDHERDSRSLRLEWACVPDVAHYTLSSCEIVLSIVSGLTVHTDRLMENTQVVAAEIASERLMLALGQHLGKQTAHEQVYELSQQARSSGAPLEQLVRENDNIRLLDALELDRIFDPPSYLGKSAALTRRTVAEAREFVATARTPEDGPEDTH
ncbi:adenylosuccinate lyase family protein [Sphaerisporangium sp. TRM90804]|uniref:class-II fumarase/aspartase family protein n=1 Tax=Sphaerisporangium sp. TRM90804 TaxID=3031113 RepID=UPI00244D73CE|nr:adenylosuccinate lyase family protein [Sphaerisporangium sp. TRM90804]MDH2428036.1 adenylosuccinate lyase family protein [Sphaerisporangium sp. TRM90804]